MDGDSIAYNKNRTTQCLGYQRVNNYLIYFDDLS